jgi:hypothetical protein
MATPLSETHYIDMLFLELSQFTKATTGKELQLESQVIRLKELCGDGLKIIKDLENNNIFSHKAVADFEQRLKDEGVVK